MDCSVTEQSIADRKRQPAHFRGRSAPALVVPDLQTVRGVNDLLDRLQAQLDAGDLETGQRTIELGRIYLAGYAAGYSAGGGHDAG